MTRQRANYPLDYATGPAEKATHQLRGTTGAAADKAKDATSTAQDLAEQVAQQMRGYGEQAQEAVKKFKPFVEKSLKEQPIATLAVVAAVGLLLGAMWKR